MKKDDLLNCPDIQLKLRELELQGYLTKEPGTWAGYGFTEKGIREATNCVSLGNTVVDWAAVLCSYTPDDWRLPTGARRWKKEANQ